MKAIVAVHLNGHCADVAALAAAFPGVPIVEDACHALGGSRLGADGGWHKVWVCPDSAIAMF